MLTNALRVGMDSFGNSQRSIGYEISENVGDQLKSTLISKNITISGHRTSVRLEPEMWGALKDIARREDCSVHQLCSLINLRKNPLTSLTAAIRVFLMLYYRAASTSEGHVRAGHGNFESMKQRAKVNADLKQGRRQNSANGMNDIDQTPLQWIFGG